MIPAWPNLWQMLPSMSTHPHLLSGNPIIQFIFELMINFRNIETHNGLAALGMFIPWLTKLFPKMSGYDEMMADLQPALDFLQSFIVKHKSNFIPDEARDLIDAYLDKIKSTDNPNSSFYGEVGGESQFKSEIVEPIWY